MSFTKEQVEEKVRRLIVEQVGWLDLDTDSEKVADASRFEEDLGFDSLNLVELVMACEEAFDLDIPDAEMSGARTVGALITLIQRRV